MTDANTWSITCIQIVSRAQHCTVRNAHHAPLKVTLSDSTIVTAAYLLQT